MKKIIHTHHKRTYSTWRHMKNRCLNKNYPKYNHYGGKGVVVCERWLNSFEDFLNDMGERPVGMTLDRINNDGNYEPDNCRWATNIQQLNNTSKNKYIMYKDQTLTLSEWSRVLGLNYELIKSRLLNGWSIEKTFTTPKRGSV